MMKMLMTITVTIKAETTATKTQRTIAAETQTVTASLMNLEHRSLRNRDGDLIRKKKNFPVVVYDHSYFESNKRAHRISVSLLKSNF